MVNVSLIRDIMQSSTAEFLGDRIIDDQFEFWFIYKDVLIRGIVEDNMIYFEIWANVSGCHVFYETTLHVVVVDGVALRERRGYNFNSFTKVREFAKDNFSQEYWDFSSIEWW